MDASLNVIIFLFVRKIHVSDTLVMVMDKELIDVVMRVLIVLVRYRVILL